MKVICSMLVAVAAAITLTAAAGAGSGGARQAFVMTAQSSKPTPNAPFVFTPSPAGPLKPDSGKETCRWSDPLVVTRDGQRVEIADDVVCTDTGKLGTLTTRTRIEWVYAGNGYHVGTGTWKVVRGTGQYAGVTGSGRMGNVWLDRGPWSARIEGVLRAP